MKHLYIILSFVFIVVGARAQDMSYGKSKFDAIGDPGTMVLPELRIQNTGAATIEVFVNRIVKNLPTNWTNCYCFINCYPPDVDTLHFFLAPSETATIGVGFSSDMVPGIGYVNLTVEQVGGTQKDTLYFSGSTLLAGIKENVILNSFSLFPNPTAEKLIINPAFKESYSVSVINTNGQRVKHFADLKEEKMEISISDISSGVYFITLTYRSGKTETKRIIKN